MNVDASQTVISLQLESCPVIRGAAISSQAKAIDSLVL
jgi:hypothetical protein